MSTVWATCQHSPVERLEPSGQQPANSRLRSREAGASKPSSAYFLSEMDTLRPVATAS